MKNNPYMNTIGLTGIMGSGKSSVSDLLEAKGAFVVRADELASEVWKENYENFAFVKKEISLLLEKSGKSEIIPQVFNQGGLNRRLLGQVIFENENMTQRLNEIIHPQVRHLFQKRVESLNNKPSWIIYDVPLLFETGLNKLMKKNIVVYAPENVAMERASRRTGLSLEEIKKRLKHQISIEKKINMADYVLDNSGELENLPTEVEKLWKFLQEIT